MRILRFFAILLGCLLGLFIVGRLINLFQYYKSPTIANAPTLPENASMFGSKLVKPKRMDFVWFMGETPYGRQLNIYRLCGIGGDVVEIKNGTLFVNGDNVDKNLNLSYSYILTGTELENIKHLLAINDNFVQPIGVDSFAIPLSAASVKQHQIKATRLIQPPSVTDSMIKMKFNENWNPDQFGPITVPRNTYFVLGDSRHHAFDSRYQGFIDKSDFSSTVFWIP